MSSRPAAPRQGLATVLLVAGLAAIATLVLSVNSGIGFFFDDWEFLLRRRGIDADAFLQPHNEHPVVAPVAIYKLLIAVFGMDSNRPFQVVAVLILLAAVTVVYVFIRRRVGPWLALAFVAPIAVCGPGWDNVLWPFQIGFTGSLACGVGAMLVVEREDRSRDGWACALLVGSLSFSSLGLCFAVAAAVLIGLGRPAWRPRAYVVAVPLVVYAGWWLGWGHEADTSLSWDNLVDSPSFVFDGFASSLSSWLGLSQASLEPTGASIETLAVGRPLLVGVVVALGLGLLLRRRVPRDVWPPLALGVSFWLLTALNANFARNPDAGRYQLIGAVIVAFIAAALLAGVRLNRLALACAMVAAVAAVAGNINALLVGRDGLRLYADIERASFTAVEIARDHVDPEFVPVPVLPDEKAGLYLAAVDSHGSPAYTDAGLAAAPEFVRATADQTIAAALAIELTPATSSATGCTTKELDGELVEQVAAPANLLMVAADDDVAADMRRYARGFFPVGLGVLPPGAGLVLELPRDRSPRPWQINLRGSGSVRLCFLEGS